jgi:hypothetical protein
MATLLEQTSKRFQDILNFADSKNKYPSKNLLEYTVFNKGKLVDEADDAQQEPPMDNQPPQGNTPDMNADSNAQMPQDNSMPPMDDMQGGGAPDMGGIPQGQDRSQGGGQAPEGLNPQENMGGDDISTDGFDDGTDINPDDEVVDITELTDEQGNTNKKIDKYGAILKKTLRQLKDVESMIQSNNEKIEQFQQEFEKRNPTQEEKLSMRAATSYPFNVSPKDYWKDKEQTSNYSLDDDENGVNQKQYTITNKDLQGTDWRSISDSMDDRLLHQSIQNTLPL